MKAGSQKLKKGGNHLDAGLRKMVGLGGEGRRTGRASCFCVCVCVCVWCVTMCQVPFSHNIYLCIIYKQWLIPGPLPFEGLQNQVGQMGEPGQGVVNQKIKDNR